MSMYDVTIIGAGVVGTSIARELSRYRLKVALLEKEEELAFGVSKSNSGIIHPGTQNPPNSLKGKLCVQGNLLTRKLAKELGVDFKEVGELIVAFSDEEIPALLELKERAEALKVPRLRIVNAEWLRKNEPNLSSEARAVLYAPSAGIISPYRLVYDLCENAVKNGVKLFTSARVENIAVPLVSASKKPYFEIFTSKGIFKTRYIINAAGLFADEISSMVGVGDFQIKPRKGEEFLLDKKRENLTRHLIFPLPSKNSKGILVIKTADGNPMIGPTAEEVKDKYDLTTTDEGFREVIAGARKMIPLINASDVIAYFAGLRPAAGEDFIIRHEDKVPGFVNVAGIQSPGLTAAPAIALLVKKILKNNGLKMKRKLNFHKYRKKTVHLFSAGLSKTKKLVKENPEYGDIVCRCEMVSAKEVNAAIERGASTLDGIKFRTRAQAGRCHGGFCTTRLMKILAEKKNRAAVDITKRGRGSEIIKQDRANG
ncbi:MAG: NAD(P)/FAD-dependent oxidoreductase [Candidatus Omnitrophota bacterium]